MIVIEQTGPAVQAALLTYTSTEECAQFEAQLRAALATAAESFDLSAAEQVLAHWHAIATMAANPPTDE